LRYSGSVQIFGLARVINTQVDTFVVGAVLPVSSVAVYNSGAGFSTQLGSIPGNALAPIGTILARAFGTGGESGAKEEFTYLQRLWVRGVAGWSAAGLGAAYFGVESWLGPQIRLSGVVAVVLVASNAIGLWTEPLNLLTAAVGRPQLVTRYGVVGTVTNLVLTVPLVLAFGLLGTVAATAIAQVLASLYFVRVVRSRYDSGIRSFLHDVPVIQSLVTAAFVAGLELVVHAHAPSGPVGLLVAGFVAVPGVVLYASLVFGPKTAIAFVRARVTGSPV
jgi:O-antigen/teichoic acid export membrane protein